MLTICAVVSQTGLSSVRDGALACREQNRADRAD